LLLIPTPTHVWVNNRQLYKFSYFKGISVEEEDVGEAEAP